MAGSSGNRRPFFFWGLHVVSFTTLAQFAIG
jgi:hypothetical protein